jgi:exodeoxyribonuclease VII large subunit
MRLHRLEARLRTLEARPGFGGFRARVAMRGRRTSELTHEMHHALRVRVAARERAWQALRFKLETFDVRRRFGALRTRLVEADGRLDAAIARSERAHDVRLRTLAARLDSLSPLGVLARGYAVCWNAERTHVIRDAAQVAPGDRVRVTLEHGEIECEAKDHL